MRGIIIIDICQIIFLIIKIIHMLVFKKVTVQKGLK